MALAEAPTKETINTPDEPRPFLWTREPYHQLAKLEVFFGQRVELIEGKIVEMSPIGFLHIKGTAKSVKAVEKAYGNGYYALSQSSLALDDDSEPQPDVAVFAGDLNDLADVPANPVLVIEVSDTTLSYDRNTKARIYARTGIADYWILDVQAEILEVYRNPMNGKYDPKTIYGKGESIAPVAASQSLILVDDLLP